MVVAGVVSSVNVKNWLKEPLLHFLLAGGLLFLVVGWLEPEDRTGLTITVGEEQLLEHLQARAQLYDRESFAAVLAAMDADERAALVREAATTEALWREGQALGLADADPLVRQRVIQQMRQIVVEEAAAGVELSDAQVEQFYADNRNRYALGAQASFSHVFLSNERRGDMARSDAEAVLRELREGDVSLADAGSYGDRFLYQRNYAEAGEREITSQFGKAFSAALFAADPGGWQGPYASEFGWHLVYVTALEPAQIPAFEEIAARAREDALAEERARIAAAALERMMERYRVVER